MEYSSTHFASIGNVTKKALRHYEKLGILTPSRIDDNGYWYYSDRDLDHLQIIRNLQVLGFSLKEIKENIENDYALLRGQLTEKKRYVDEQIIQLEMAKRLLLKIEKKEGLPVVDALAESLEEEHIDWYRRNLTARQFTLVENMMSSPDAMEEHEQMIAHLKSFKQAYAKSERSQMRVHVQKIVDLFAAHKLTKKTIRVLIENFLKSNLEGPLSMRILSVEEVVVFMELLV